jgi:hypothetical protein
VVIVISPLPLNLATLTDFGELNIATITKAIALLVIGWGSQPINVKLPALVTFENVGIGVLPPLLSVEIDYHSLLSINGEDYQLRVGYVILAVGREHLCEKFHKLAVLFHFLDCAGKL